MSIPRFSAEASLGQQRTGRFSGMSRQGKLSGGVVPALPLGGYRCVALAAACRRGSKLACSALATCNSGGVGGGECGVNDDGSVTCCYAGDCTTYF
jgi:hypothetical protein